MLKWTIKLFILIMLTYIVFNETFAKYKMYKFFGSKLTYAVFIV